MLQMTAVADWFLDRAHFPSYRDRIRGRTFILVLGLTLVFQSVMGFLLPDQKRVLAYMNQILIQVICLLVLLTYTRFTGHYRAAAITHFILQKFLMALVFYRSESLHSAYFASMGTDVVVASFILGARLAIPLVLFQALATLAMVYWNKDQAQQLPFAMDLATYAGILASSLFLAQLVIIVFSWLYHGSLQSDYARLQHERTRLFRSARSFDLSRMLGELNHHVNNPLSIIHAQLYRLALQVRQGTARVPEQQLSEAGAQALQKIRFIVEHLKALASPDTQEQLSSIPIRGLCLNILTHFQEGFRLKGITLRFVDQTMNMSFLWRRHELFTILAALLQNAAEALEEAPEKIITVRIERSFQWLIFHVHDTGSGISEEQRERLFKPFHSTKQGSQHLGLSLLSAKAVLEERGGSIICEDVTQGCSFQVTLPLPTSGS
jgi:signal transduction histidine kinase